jgi:hypothetical protein
VNTFTTPKRDARSARALARFTGHLADRAGTVGAGFAMRPCFGWQAFRNDNGPELARTLTQRALLDYPNEEDPDLLDARRAAVRVPS